MSKSLEYQRLRAPKNDGDLFLTPDWATCQTLPRKNRELFDSYDFQVFGESFQQLRSEAQREVVRLAKQYTAAYADVPASSDGNRPIIMSGHQPQLFHPGVWAKNFLIDKIANEHNGIAVQVIVDNDTMRSSSIRVPTGSRTSPTVVTEPFDAHADPLPYETRGVRDMSVLKSFPDRISRAIAPFVSNPLVNDLWPHVIDAVKNNKVLGNAFAQARHQIELQNGLRTLEVPLSQLCDTNAFRMFALHMLGNVNLVRCYNARLEEYRKVHRLRSPAQPMPNLKQHNGWTESPFWFWTVQAPARKALWFKWVGNSNLEIGDPSESWTLRYSTRTRDSAIEDLKKHTDSGLSIRPRALTNTMFLRLFCSECFIHGIGGAKYDQITDALLYDLFHIETPHLIGASQTTLLPVDVQLVTEREIAEKRHILRQMHFHPEQFLNSGIRNDPQVSCIEKTKQHWIEMELPWGERLERHQQIEKANAKLREYLLESTENQKNHISELNGQRKASEIFGSREWSFSLFPCDFLVRHLLDLKFTDS